MVSYSKRLVIFSLGAAAVSGLPIQKRIAQTIAEATAKWEDACIAAGGGLKCNPISVSSMSTLLAAAGPCEQQNAADEMINFAKELGNDADMIALAQIFAQQPRNTPSSESVPYCQEAPQNAELEGLFQCQFDGADPDTFVGGLAVGDEGTIPFGLNAPLDPPGSCPANPGGPIADGSQLSDLTRDPGVDGNAASADSDNDAGTNDDDSVAGDADTGAADPSDGASTEKSSSSAASNTSEDTGDFRVQNGRDAQALNDSFKSLTADSTCTDGDQACIEDGFAQCVGGKFVLMPCGTGTVCKALPLVKKPGTSITCTTEEDAQRRIETALNGGF